MTKMDGVKKEIAERNDGRTFYGSIFIATACFKEFFNIVARDFHESREDKRTEDGVIFSGINACFEKDDIEWGAFIDHEKAIYFEISDTNRKKWMNSFVMRLFQEIGIRCVTKEKGEYLAKEIGPIRKQHEATVKRLRKKLMEMDNGKIQKR